MVSGLSSPIADLSYSARAGAKDIKISGEPWLKLVIGRMTILTR